LRQSDVSSQPSALLGQQSSKKLRLDLDALAFASFAPPSPSALTTLSGEPSLDSVNTAAGMEDPVSDEEDSPPMVHPRFQQPLPLHPAVKRSYDTVCHLDSSPTPFTNSWCSRVTASRLRRPWTHSRQDLALTLLSRRARDNVLTDTPASATSTLLPVPPATTKALRTERPYLDWTKGSRPRWHFEGIPSIDSCGFFFFAMTTVDLSPRFTPMLTVD
jgi:hypothetical protein